MERYNTVQVFNAPPAPNFIQKKKQTSMTTYGISYACQAQSVQFKIEKTV